MSFNPWFALLFTATAGLALWGMLTRNPWVPPWVHRHDKFMHFGAFAVLAGFAQLTYPRASPLLLCALLGGFGVVAEGLQQLFSSRRFCWRDATANVLGAATMLTLLHWQS